MLTLMILAVAGVCVFVLAGGIYFFRFALLRHAPPDYAKKAKMKNTPVARYGDRIAAWCPGVEECRLSGLKSKVLTG